MWPITINMLMLLQYKLNLKIHMIQNVTGDILGIYINMSMSLCLKSRVGSKCIDCLTIKLQFCGNSSKSMLKVRLILLKLFHS